MHATESGLKKCTCMQIKSEILETKIFSMIKNTMFDPVKLRECMNFFKRRGQANQLRLAKQLKKTDIKMEKITGAKKRILDLYASGEIEKDVYVKRSIECDIEMNRLKSERSELIRQIPLLHKREVIETSINEYCETAKIRFEKCNNFEIRRQFLLDYVGKIVHSNDKIEFYASVPIQIKSQDKEQNLDMAKIEFCIRDSISMSERRNRKYRQIGCSYITKSEYDQPVIKSQVR